MLKILDCVALLFLVPLVAFFIELLEVCFVLARVSHMCLLALAFVVTGSHEYKLAAFLQVVVEHRIRDALAVEVVLLNHILVVQATLFQGPVVVGVKLQLLLGSAPWLCPCPLSFLCLGWRWLGLRQDAGCP